MEDATYQFQAGRRTPKVSAQVVGERLEHLRQVGGGQLTTKAVVKDARPVKAALHPCFTWDDAKAGEQWRLHEARNLIRSVEVVVKDATGEERRGPAMIHVPTVTPGERAGYYQSASVIAERPDEFALAAAELSRKLTSAASALEHVRAIKSGQVPDKVAALAAISEALATARGLTARLQ
ncbi:MAG: hypothetical protein VW405_15575 [Rhodospirillaceae bacterium]